MPDTTMYHTSSSDSGSAVDKRGHLFRFPSLGLPDPAGEWVIIRAAIGNRKNATSKLKNDGIEPPMRYAYQGCGSMDIDYDGAIWVTPLVGANQVSGKATELFLLKTRRLPLSSQHQTVLTKVAAREVICHVVHPRGMEEFKISPQPTSSDDKAFWSMTLAALAKGSNEQQREQEEEEDQDDAQDEDEVGPLSGFDQVREHLAALEKRPDVKEENVSRWREKPRDILEPEWWSKTKARALRDAKLTRTPISKKGPGFALRFTPADNDGVRFDYAILVDDRELPSSEEWRRLPLSALKPGYAFLWTNKARERWGRKLLTEDEWASMQRDASPSPTLRRNGGGDLGEGGEEG